MNLQNYFSITKNAHSYNFYALFGINTIFKRVLHFLCYRVTAVVVVFIHVVLWYWFYATL